MTNNVKKVALCRIDETDTQVLRRELDLADFNPDKPFTRDLNYESSESESEHKKYSSEYFFISEHHETPNQKRIEMVIPKKRIAKRLYKELPNLTNQIIKEECFTNLSLALEEMKLEQIPGTELITYYNAMISYETSQWLEIMENEFQSLIQSKTWSLVKFLKNKKAIKIKWMFKYKPIMIPETDQILIKYKTRLVAKGFMQRHGIDFDKTYASVIRLSSYRVIFAWVASRDWFIHSGDVKTAFLNRNLEKSVYVH